MKQTEEEILFWGYRSWMVLGLMREGMAVRVHPTFHRGRIVYGGRLIVDLAAESITAVEQHFDEDMGDWPAKEEFISRSIKIDTVLMQVY
ncbi:MAG TPA: hypothetical protein VM118_00465 [Acidobacteriota bacterium]|nr:hypothetical protein [Acidobacteriota bacterium]